MKKIYIVLISLLSICNTKAQIVNFADAQLEDLLLSSTIYNDIAHNAGGSRIRIDANYDNHIQLSEALSVYELGIGGNINITSLSGIGSFSNLKKLRVNNCVLSSLNVTALSNLQELDCSQNSLTQLNITGLSNLFKLNCRQNNLTTLNYDGCSALAIIDCSVNKYASLNFIGLHSLISLDCQANYLLASLYIDSTNLTSLNFETCYSLNNLDLGGLTALQTIYGSNCSLDTINLTGLINLRDAYLNGNQLTYINTQDLQNLTNLSFNNNLITALDATTLPLLGVLQCNDNRISTLDFSLCPNLAIVYCNNNLLTLLNVRNGHGYETVYSNTLQFSGNSNLQFVCCDSFEVGMIQYMINSFGYTNIALNQTCALNTDTVDFKNGITVFPNPAKEILNIETNDTLINSINIYNTLGQLVIAIPDAKQIFKIDVSHLHSGNYFIKINSDKGTTNAKFVKN